MSLAAVLPLFAACLLAASAQAQPPQPGDVTVTTTPGIYTDFSPGLHDYVVRCDGGPVTVQGHTSAEWEAQVGSYPYLSGGFVEPVPLNPGEAFTITVRRVGTDETYSYYVRCLPSDFPTYTFTRYGPVTPKFFSVDQEYGSSGQRYAMVFNNYGVPVWWYPAPAKGARVLGGKNILWADRYAAPSDWVIHSLAGATVRTLTAVGKGANPHDLRLLPNGGYQLGSYVRESNVDTSAYGGSKHATVVNNELQQVDSNGNLVWDWHTEKHVSLAETPGRIWKWVVKHPEGYDIAHWNSIEPDGGSVIASFRNLDAVYKIRKSPGNIVWKLGGTKTSKSLTVKGDPRRYPLGAQHDARLLSDRTVTIFNNRTNLDQPRPEADRFRIDQKNKTATLLQAITDPAVTASYCCGSARRMTNGQWLIDWGQNNGIGGYKPNKDRTFFLRFSSGFSYRAEPVPDGAASAQDFREGMDAICAATSC
jgi:Arylsulfotransferase (ASST)